MKKKKKNRCQNENHKNQLLQSDFRLMMGSNWAWGVKSTRD